MGSSANRWLTWLIKSPRFVGSWKWWLTFVIHGAMVPFIRRFLPVLHLPSGISRQVWLLSRRTLRSRGFAVEFNIIQLVIWKEIWWINKLYGSVWKCRVPLNPMVFMIIIPMKNGYFIGNIPYFQTNPYQTMILDQKDTYDGGFIICL